MKFYMWGSVQEVVIYFKFHENRSRVSELWKVKNRPVTGQFRCTTLELYNFDAKQSNLCCFDGFCTNLCCTKAAVSYTHLTLPTIYSV